MRTAAGRSLLVAGTVAGLSLVPMASGQAATGGCSYPPNNPVLNLQVSPTQVTAHQPITAFGNFEQNNCPITNAKILIQAQRLISGNPSGAWETKATATTTTPDGTYGTSFTLLFNSRVRAVFGTDGNFPTTVSPKRNVAVRTGLYFRIGLGKKCVIYVAGHTTPVKANRYVYVQNRAPAHQFNGWTTIAFYGLSSAYRGSNGYMKTDTNGIYRGSRTVNCAKVYNLSAYINGDSSNLAGRSQTIFNIRPTR
jgi:hypothetical protein